MNDPRSDLAQRIVGSPHLISSPKLCEFFLYVVDLLSPRGSGRSGQSNMIGVHVFHRIPGYNSSDDSIVRSQARLLRMKLSAYFSNEGSNEDLIVEIPEGTLSSCLPSGEPKPSHDASVCVSSSG